MSRSGSPGQHLHPRPPIPASHHIIMKVPDATYLLHCQAHVSAAPISTFNQSNECMQTRRNYAPRGLCPGNKEWSYRALTKRKRQTIFNFFMLMHTNIEELRPKACRQDGGLTEHQFNRQRHRSPSFAATDRQRGECHE
eukprot:scaffold206392_cov22-Tisochrysis_lutea.AAC.2